MTQQDPGPGERSRNYRAFPLRATASGALAGAAHAPRARGSSIPQKKIANVRQVHAAHLPTREVVLGVYDGTAFGSAKDGWAITWRRLCFKNQMMAPQMLEWSDIREHEVFADGNRLVVGRAELDTLFAADDRGLWAWCDAIMTLARSARPASEVRAETRPARAEPEWRLDDAGYNGWRLAVSPRGDVLIGAGFDGIAVFDAHSGRPRPRFQFPCARSVTWPEPRMSLLGRLRGDDESPIYSWSP